MTATTKNRIAPSPITLALANTTPGALRYGLEVCNPLTGEWHPLPGYSAATMTEAVCHGMATLENIPGIITRAVPLFN